MFFARYLLSKGHAMDTPNVEDLVTIDIYRTQK